MCTLLELDIGIMTTCMPGMKLFVTWMRGTKAKAGLAPVEDDTIGGGGGGGGVRKVQRGWDSALRSGVSAEEAGGCVDEEAEKGDGSTV